MIYADVHEPSAIIDMLRQKISVKVLRNYAGDYTFNNTAIERKSLSDFFSSIASGRLYAQLETLMKFEKPYLIVEGFFDFSHVNNPNYLYSSLRAISIDMDMRILFTKDMSDTAYTIKKIYYSQFYLPECKVPWRSNFRLMHLKAFFGTGPDKLTKLFSEFKSIRHLANADKKSMAKVRGIGIKTATAVENALDEGILSGEEQSFYCRRHISERAAMDEDEEMHQTVWIILNTVKNLKLGKNRLAAYLKGSWSKSVANVSPEQGYGGLIWLDIATIEGFIEQLENIGLIRRKIVASNPYNYSVFEITDAGRLVLDEKMRIPVQKIKKLPTVGHSENKTHELLKKGMETAEIAKERSLAESTIYSHYATLIANGKISSLEVISADVERRVREESSKFRVFPSAKEIKEFLPDISYEEIRCALAGIR
ncbi:helix-turn-helix domain-containing protein [Candidatus Woesearchaeota archaeon]|nr:helix-turn-helix domain-containing protein [Candidatus Woesearchaeota archaeon]